LFFIGKLSFNQCSEKDPVVNFIYFLKKFNFLRSIVKMEVEEMERKEVQAEIPWIPTTPVKPIVPKSAPICTPMEGNSQIYHQANGAFACSEFSHGTVPAVTITDIDGQNGKICEKTASDNVSSAESMFPTEVASTSSCATRVGDNNGLNDLVVPSVVSENSRDPHGKCVLQLFLILVAIFNFYFWYNSSWGYL
jgi:hypothetical protein